MDWIKTKYDRAILLVAAVILLAAAVLVFLSIKNFSETFFASYFAPFTKSNSGKSVSVDRITEARDALANPAKWARVEARPVFVGVEYVLRKSGVLEAFDSSLTEIVPGIPNKWFLDNGLDLLAADIAEQDPDGDHFSNREEYGKGGASSTNPNDATSHPPFSDKLRLAKFIKIPFRLIFIARNDDEMQINTVDLRQPSQFLKVGDKIAGTKFQITKLDVKSGVDSYGTPKDTSEATIRQTETGEEIILVIGLTADSPNTSALFKYLYDGSEFKVKRDGDFQLKPDDKTTYKLIDINSNEAVITIPATGAKLTIPKA